MNSFAAVTVLGRERHVYELFQFNICNQFDKQK